MTTPSSPTTTLAGATDPAVFGGKAAALARLHAAGVLVPPSRVLPTVTPETDLTAIVAELCRWADDIGHATLVVRSSATDEDGTVSSFAGLYLSRFTPADPMAVLAALTEVRDSALAPAADAYAAARRGTDEAVTRAMAILVQPALRPVAAGVLAAELRAGKLTDWRIEVVRGLAEPLVAGRVTGEIHTGRGAASAPATLPADQPTTVLPATAHELTVPPGDWLSLPLLTGSIPAKVDTSGDGLLRLHTPPDWISAPILAPTNRGRLLALARTVATTLELDRVDIEWAHDHDGTLVVLQARPLTTALPPADSPAEAGRTGLAASPGAASGPIVHLHAGLAAEVVRGAVLVCGALDADAVGVLLQGPAALISTTGGPLSHTAIIARELSIPCVTNVTDAASTYPPGSIVHVDGTRGTVATYSATLSEKPTFDGDLTRSAVLSRNPDLPRTSDGRLLTLLLHERGDAMRELPDARTGFFQATTTPAWPEPRPVGSRDITVPGLGRLLMPAATPVPGRLVALTPSGVVIHERRLRTRPQPRHIVWDWNGTLLDDNVASLAGINAICAHHGRSLVTLEQWREHFQRPPKKAYEQLLGRVLTSEEGEAASITFRRISAEARPACGLAIDATEGLVAWLATGDRTQSLLSMTPQYELVAETTARELNRYFTSIRGLPDNTCHSKTDHLRTHMTAANLSANDVVVIGDSEDDARAALDVGTDLILVATGTTSRARLDMTGAVVVNSIADALSLLDVRLTI